MPRKFMTGVLAIVALLAACGGEAAGGPCPDAPPSPAPTPPYNDDPELAGRLPTEIGGEELQVYSRCVSTTDFGGLNLSEPVLEAVGVELSDVTVAVAQTTAMGEDSPFVSVVAFRYPGADEAALRTAVTDTLAEADTPHETETIAGKEVIRVLGAAVWYVAGDALYLITAENPEVEAVLSALP